MTPEVKEELMIATSLATLISQDVKGLSGQAVGLKPPRGQFMSLGCTIWKNDPLKQEKKENPAQSIHSYLHNSIKPIALSVMPNSMDVFTHIYIYNAV